MQNKECSITVFCFCHLSNVWFSNYSLASEWDWGKPVIHTLSICSPSVFLAVECWLMAGWLWRITAVRNLSFSDWAAARLGRQRQGWLPGEPQVQLQDGSAPLSSFPLATPALPRSSWPCLMPQRFPQVLPSVPDKIMAWPAPVHGQWIMQLG